MIDALFVDEQVNLAATVLMPSVMAVMNLDTLHRTSPTRLLHQECHATMADFIQGIDTLATRGIDHTPIMAPDIGYFSAGHNPAPTTTVTEATGLEGTPHAPLPTTTAARAASQPMDAPITPHAMTPTGIVAPNPTLATSSRGATHATPQTESGLAPETPAIQHKDIIQEKSSNTRSSSLTSPY